MSSISEDCETTNIVFDESKSVDLVMFSNGDLKRDSCDDIKFTCYKKKPDCKRGNSGSDQRILVGETSDLQYTGSNFDPWTTQKTEHYQYFVGVRNKRTGEMVVYPANLFDLKCNIQCTRKSVKTQDVKTYTEKVDILAREFGSKRKKKATETKMKYNVGSNMISSVAEDIKELMPQSDPKPAEDPSFSVVPVQNKNAISAGEVYCLSDVISEYDYNALGPNGDLLKESSLAQIKDWKVNSVFCSYVLSHLEKFLSQTSMHNAKLLCYFNYLVILLRLGYKDLRKKDPVPEIPEPFKRRLLDKFVITAPAEQGKLNRSMPLRMKDKVMAHAMVLALFIDDFVVDATQLQHDFKVPMSKITKLAYALGCHFYNRKRNNKSVSLIELKLPLVNPSEKLQKRKRI